MLITALVTVLMFEVAAPLPNGNGQAVCNKHIYSVMSKKQADKLKRKGVVLGCAFNPEARRGFESAKERNGGIPEYLDPQPEVKIDL